MVAHGAKQREAAPQSVKAFCETSSDVLLSIRIVPTVRKNRTQISETVKDPHCMFFH